MNDIYKMKMKNVRQKNLNLLCALYLCSVSSGFSYSIKRTLTDMMIEKQVLISYYHIVDYQIFTVKTRSIIFNNFCIQQNPRLYQILQIVHNNISYSLNSDSYWSTYLLTLKQHTRV